MEVAAAWRSPCPLSRSLTLSVSGLFSPSAAHLSPLSVVPTGRRNPERTRSSIRSIDAHLRQHGTAISALGKTSLARFVYRVRAHVCPSRACTRGRTYVRTYVPTYVCVMRTCARARYVRSTTIIRRRQFRFCACRRCSRSVHRRDGTFLVTSSHEEPLAESHG